MYTITADNVDQAYTSALMLISSIGRQENSRNGPVLVAPTPVMTVYNNPTDRVLLNRYRKANHAFHINEAIWMLAGSKDAKWLDQFIHDFSSRYARQDGTLDGAYGARWRRHFSSSETEGCYLDQLEEVIDVLKRDPSSRRAVVAMHDPSCDLNVNTKDQPCNTHLYFRVRDEVLDMTVMCRSNDIIWGAYGANAVHFSVLQEYIAAAIGVGVGRMYQFSNNWHAYLNVLDKIDTKAIAFDSYVAYEPTPLVLYPKDFITDCENWVRPSWETQTYINPWFDSVLYPIRQAYNLCKVNRLGDADDVADMIKDFKWRKGMIRWIESKRKADADKR